MTKRDAVNLAVHRTRSNAAFFMRTRVKAETGHPMYLHRLIVANADMIVAVLSGGFMANAVRESINNYVKLPDVPVSEPKVHWLVAALPITILGVAAGLLIFANYYASPNYRGLFDYALLFQVTSVSIGTNLRKATLGSYAWAAFNIIFLMGAASWSILWQ